jgi:hypothetical protein
MRLPVAPVLAMLLSFAILAGPMGTALAQAELDHTQRIQMEVVGFLDQGEKFLLKVQDPNIGSKFEVWDSRDVKLLRAFIFLATRSGVPSRRCDEPSARSSPPPTTRPTPAAT